METVNSITNKQMQILDTTTAKHRAKKCQNSCNWWNWNHPDVLEQN